MHRNQYDLPQAYQLPLEAHDDIYISRNAVQLQELSEIPRNTLDDGISTTMCSELTGALDKFKLTLFPFCAGEQQINKIRNWDLWGPFMLSILYILLIDSGTSYQILLYSVFYGASIVTFNIRVLGGQMSYMQSVSIIAYCMFPLFLTIVILNFMKLASYKSAPVRIASLTVASLWCMFAISIFISKSIKADRRFVAIFPVALLYIYIGVNMFFQFY